MCWYFVKDKKNDEQNENIAKGWNIMKSEVLNYSVLRIK